MLACPRWPTPAYLPTYLVARVDVCHSVCAHSLRSICAQLPSLGHRQCHPQCHPWSTARWRMDWLCDRARVLFLLLLLCCPAMALIRLSPRWPFSSLAHAMLGGVVLCCQNRVDNELNRIKGALPILHSHPAALSQRGQSRASLLFFALHLQSVFVGSLLACCLLLLLPGAASWQVVCPEFFGGFVAFFSFPFTPKFNFAKNQQDLFLANKPIGTSLSLCSLSAPSASPYQMASQGYHYSPYSNLSSDPPTQMAAPQQQPANLTVGHCMYCKSPLCYPDNITVFRCTTCDTINDLAPIPVPASSEPLSLQNINEKILFCQQRYTSYAVDYMPLEKYLREHLSSLAAINACFSTNQPATKDHCGVDLEQTRAAFKALARLPPISGITNAVSKAFDGLLQRPGRDITGTNDLKFIMIMLECPWLSRNNGKEETELHHTILKRLFTITSNLHPDHHRVLRQWFSTTLPKEIFTNRVNLINKFITKRLSVQQNSVPPRQYRNDPRIKAAARVMQLFFLANHSNEISQTSGRGDANYVIVPSYKDLGRPAKLIQLDEFYNTMVDIIDLPYDFATWEDRGAPFTFCNYPFLISMGSKMQIMSWDAKRQMELEKETTIKKLLQQRKRDSPDTHSITLTAMEIQQAQLITLYVNRSNLIAESLTQLSEKQSALKKALRIVFIGEDGIDAGGLRKEWFLLLVRQLFDPQYGMFVYDDDSQYCWFNPSSFESLGEFYLVGIVIGLAIYNSTILDLPLPTAVYKKLLNVPLTLEDLAQFRPGLASGFQDLLKYEGDDVEDVFCVDFTMSYEYFGEPIVAPLVPGGAQKPVTKDNKEEYVERYANYVMNDSITDQFEYFRKGFYLVCGGGALSLFRPEEIEYLVRGSEEPLDIDTLRSVTVYEGFQDDHDVIKNFWSIFKEMESKEQRRLLQFITASDRYPATGISNLTFKITCIGATDSDRFPTTHTCFNQLCLYNYTGREKLKRMLTRAMNESEGFGVK